MKANVKFRLVDVCYILMMVLPIAVMCVLKILFTPESEGISITGALVYFTIPFPIQDLPISEAQVNSFFVLISITGLFLYLTHGLTDHCDRKRQHLAEWIVEQVDKLVMTNMGPRFSGYAPFIIAILGLSAFSSLLALFGLYSPTSDINIVGGWAILVFILITYWKLKGGFFNYLKGFTEPIAIMTPLNILGEVATPVSMAFRHYGNVMSGSVIAVLVAAALQALSSLVLGFLPGFLSEIPLFRVGIPAVLSVYFDIFSSCMQAFIFAMLTMLNISSNFPEEAYNERMAKKAKKQKKSKIKN